jgi:hypothetical protein
MRRCHHRRTGVFGRLGLYLKLYPLSVAFGVIGTEPGRSRSRFRAWIYEANSPSTIPAKARAPQLLTGGFLARVQLRSHSPSLYPLRAAFARQRSPAATGGSFDDNTPEYGAVSRRFSLRAEAQPRAFGITTGNDLSRPLFVKAQKSNLA